MPPFAVAGPGVVPREALDFFESKGLRPSFDYTDVWKSEHNVAFAVAKLTELKLLSNVQESLVKALADGTPFQQWKREIKSTFDKSGWSNYQRSPKEELNRLRVIYETNMRVARSVGQWERIQATKETHPYLTYRLGPSFIHRVQHEAWAGTTLLVDDKFWDSAMPPNGYGCLCYVAQETRARAEAHGGETKRPDLTLEPWVDKKTGRVEQVPRGIQPGWNFNPGKQVLRGRQLEQKQRESQNSLDDLQRQQIPGEAKNAAQLFRDLIMEGKFTDQQILDQVTSRFGAGKRDVGHVAWYRRELTKKGLSPPPRLTATGESVMPPVVIER